MSIEIKTTSIANLWLPNKIIGKTFISQPSLKLNVESSQTQTSTSKFNHGIGIHQGGKLFSIGKRCPRQQIEVLQIYQGRLS